MLHSGTSSRMGGLTNDRLNRATTRTISIHSQPEFVVAAAKACAARFTAKIFGKGAHMHPPAFQTRNLLSHFGSCLSRTGPQFRQYKTPFLSLSLSAQSVHTNGLFTPHQYLTLFWRPNTPRLGRTTPHSYLSFRLQLLKAFPCPFY